MGGCLLPGVSAPGGVSALRVSALGGCLLWGVSVLGGGIPACTEADTPPVNRMTDRCKNITLATTSLRPVNMLRENISRATTEMEDIVT